MSNLADLQTLVAALFSEDTALTSRSVAVLAEQRGDIETAVEDAVARLGVVAIVMSSGGTFLGDDPAGGGPLLEDQGLTVRVLETPSLNRSRTPHATALQVAEHVACKGHAEGLHLREIRIYDAGEEMSAYDVVFACAAAQPLEALSEPEPEPEPEPDPEP
jgi:hypothetical protein